MLSSLKSIGPTTPSSEISVRRLIKTGPNNLLINLILESLKPPGDTSSKSEKGVDFRFFYTFDYFFSFDF